MAKFVNGFSLGVVNTPVFPCEIEYRFPGSGLF